MKTLEPQMDRGPSLESLDIKLPELATPEKPEIIEPPEIYNLQFNGVSLSVKIKKKSTYSEVVNYVPHIDISISVSAGKAMDTASLSIALSRDLDGKWIAIQSVENLNRDIKRLGRTLWEVALRFIQKFADEVGAPVIDEIIRMPNMELGFTGKKWNELFYPLLEKYGYVQNTDDPNKWFHLYEPRTK